MDSFDATIATKDVELVFLLDEDDPARSDYIGLAITGPAYGDPCQPLNAAALWSRSEIVGFIGDDSRLMTPGWDVQVIRALQTPGFCWGFDGTSSQPWPSTAFITTEIVKTLGYMVPPGLRRGFFDVAWTVLATATDSIRLVDAMFAHDNSRGDPSKPNYDPTYRVPPAVIAADERAYNDWTKRQAAQDIRLLRHALYS